MEKQGYGESVEDRKYQKFLIFQVKEGCCYEVENDCFAIFFILNGLWVFFETDAGKYVVVEGRCTGIEKTPLRKRIKNIHIETDDITVKVIVKQRMKQLAIGDNIRVYVFEKTPVYDQEQCKLLCSYLALEKTRRESENGDSRGFIADSGGDQETGSDEF